LTVVKLAIEFWIPETVPTGRTVPTLWKPVRMLLNIAKAPLTRLTKIGESTPRGRPLRRPEGSGRAGTTPVGIGSVEITVGVGRVPVGNGRLGRLPVGNGKFGRPPVGKPPVGKGKLGRPPVGNGNGNPFNGSPSRIGPMIGIGGIGSPSKSALASAFFAGAGAGRANTNGRAIARKETENCILKDRERED